MPYVLQTAFVKERSNGGRWKEIDLSTTPIRSLHKPYSSIILKATHTNDQGNVFIIDFFKERHLVQNPNGTIPDWFNALGNRMLNNQNLSLKIKEKTAIYYDVWETVINEVRPTKLGMHPDTVVIESECEDVLLMHNSIDRVKMSYDDIYKSSIFTVNGYVHRASLSTYGITLADADKTRKVSNNSKLGLISFEGVANLSFLDITPAMIAPNATQNNPNPYPEYHLTTRLKLGVNLTGKTLMLSIGGYLHVMDKIYEVVNYEEGIIQINFRNIPLVHRHYETKKCLDMSEFSLVSLQEENPNIHYLDDIIRSNQYVLDILNMSQTFAIIADKELFKEMRTLSDSNLDGISYANSPITGALFSQRGRIKEYASKEEQGIWVAHHDSTGKETYLMETTNWRTHTLITDMQSFPDAYVKDSVKEVKIGVSILE